MNQFGQNSFAVNRALELSRKIEVADSFETLIIYAEEARRIDESFLGAGLGGALTTYAISWLNDCLAARGVALSAEEARLPAANWCWISLGSEGRHEQTLVTDQDNGLVFSATDEHKP